MASDYHARIMNIPCEKRGLYAQGHRDARQAAAEIASEAEAEVERLRAAIIEWADSRTRTYGFSSQEEEAQRDVDESLLDIARSLVPKEDEDGE